MAADQTFTLCDEEASLLLQIVIDYKTGKAGDEGRKQYWDICSNVYCKSPANPAKIAMHAPGARLLISVICFFVSFVVNLTKCNKIETKCNKMFHFCQAIRQYINIYNLILGLNLAIWAKTCTVGLFTRDRTKYGTVPVKKLTCFFQVLNLHT